MEKTTVPFVLVVSVLIIGVILGSGITLVAVGLRQPVSGQFVALQQPTPQVVTQPQAQPPQPSVDLKTLEDDDPVLGKADAPVTIIAFEDYQCPFCGRFSTQTLPQIKKDYIDTGKAKLVFRDFPLSFHQYAQKAHEAANCAGEQKKYWEMHNLLFKNRGALDISDLKNYAKQLGLNQQQFDSCLDSGKTEAEIQKDIQDGTAAGVSGTPAFIINGKSISGAQPYDVFKAAIETFLSR